MIDRYRLILVLFAGSVAALFFALPFVTNYSPDSWTMYELANTVGRDFFHANTAREYTSGSEHSSAFAPLWPVLIAPFVRLAGGISGSYVAAFAVYVAFAVAAEHLGRRVFATRGAGLLSALLLLRFLGLRGELGGGRSIPLYLLEIALLGALLLDAERMSSRRLVVLGFLTGALVMTRFDALPAALVVLFGLPFLGVRGRRLAPVLAGFAAAVSPWVVYSLVHFHTPFATDNRYVAMAIDTNAYVFDFHAAAPLSARDAPGAWMLKVFRNIPATLASIVGAVRESVFLPLVLAFALWRAYRDGAGRPVLFPSRALILLLLVVLAPVGGYVITGYGDHRYYTAAIWLLEFLAVGYLLQGDAPLYRRSAMAFALVGAALSLAVLRFAITPETQALARQRLDRAAIDTLVQCLRRAGGRPTDAVWFRGGQVVNPFKFGALTGWRTLPNPSNWTRLDATERAAFVAKYKPTFLVDARAALDDATAHPSNAVECALPVQRIAGERR